MKYNKGMGLIGVMNECTCWKREDKEKILWILGGMILSILVISVHILFLTIQIPYLLIMGAYFRGKNWILSWDKVKVLKVKVR